MKSRLAVLGVAGLGSLLAALVAVGGLDLPDLDPEPSSSTSAATAGESSEDGSASAQLPAAIPAEGGEDLEQLLAEVDVVDERPDVAGYDRECGTEHACSFGPAWTDDTAGEFGHNGCGTRDDVLARDLTAITYRAGTDECVVESGVLEDPYTGETIEFSKSRAHEVGVDHIYPLARAWDLGASTWSQEHRKDFANDPINLVAVSGRANSSKQDRGPGEWMPINAAHRCTYIAGFLEVAIAYELPITAADLEAATLTAESC